MIEITYHKEGDYFISDLYLEKEDYENDYIIGKYGHLRLEYLKNHKKAEYIIWAENYLNLCSNYIYCLKIFINYFELFPYSYTNYNNILVFQEVLHDFPFLQSSYHL